jgi:cysteine desulfuration protein SufE
MSVALSELPRYNEFVEALDIIDDEDMRFEYIIDMGKRRRDIGFPEEMKIDANQMHGCMSRVWIIDQPKDGLHYFVGDSDAIIVKGLVAMMTESFSGLTGQQLQKLTIDQISKLNLGALTTQRQVGMMAMLQHMQKMGRAGQFAGSF